MLPIKVGQCPRMVRCGAGKAVMGTLGSRSEPWCLNAPILGALQLEEFPTAELQGLFCTGDNCSSSLPFGEPVRRRAEPRGLVFTAEWNLKDSGFFP